jgi:hypothetical protein
LSAKKVARPRGETAVTRHAAGIKKNTKPNSRQTKKLLPMWLNKSATYQCEQTPGTAPQLQAENTKSTIA